MSSDYNKVDKESYKASMDRLYAIFEGISDTATETSKWRCPYKNARSRCTANFKCRNQKHIAQQPDELAMCTASDKLDYRSAWEV